MSTIIKLPMKVVVDKYYQDIYNNYVGIDLPSGINNILTNIEYFQELSKRYYEDNDITVLEDEMYKAINNTTNYNSIEDIEFTITDDNTIIWELADTGRFNQILDEAKAENDQSMEYTGYSEYSEPTYSDLAPSDV